jgi:hypothetical protein
MFAVTILFLGLFQPPAVLPPQLPLQVKQAEQRAADARRRHQELLQRADELFRQSEETTLEIKRLIKEGNDKLDKIEKMQKEKK